MLYVKAGHIIAMVAWFAGLFYLPRLFVYHVDAVDSLSYERFKIMEKRLYFGITWPAALVTTVLGAWLVSYQPQYYLHAGWMHGKLSLVVLLWGYHLSCGYYLGLFAQGRNKHSTRYFRLFNELPTILLIAIVLLVVVKPF
jgi:protoporphyrinogen IX oxidase